MSRSAEAALIVVAALGFLAGIAVVILTADYTFHRRSRRQMKRNASGGGPQH